jgi:hypothetical protein
LEDKKNLQVDVEGDGRGNMPYFLGEIRPNLKDPQDSQKLRRLTQVFPSVLNIYNVTIFGIFHRYFIMIHLVQKHPTQNPSGFT